MELGVWMVIGFGIGFSAGIAADRLRSLFRNIVGRQENRQAPLTKPLESDPNSSLPPFPRLRPPPR
jgi:hypothetical protein